MNISHCRAASSSIVLGASGDPPETCTRVVDDGLGDDTTNCDGNVENLTVWREGDDKNAMQVLRDDSTMAAVANA